MADNDENAENIPADNTIRHPTTVFVGEGSKPVSVQLIQEIFNELTGKNESLTESFSKPYQVVFADIENLYFKLHQTLEQYRVISDNCSAIIYYLNNTRE